MSGPTGRGYGGTKWGSSTPPRPRPTQATGSRNPAHRKVTSVHKWGDKGAAEALSAIQSERHVCWDTGWVTGHLSGERRGSVTQTWEARAALGAHVRSAGRRGWGAQQATGDAHVLWVRGHVTTWNCKEDGAQEEGRERSGALAACWVQICILKSLDFVLG